MGNLYSTSPLKWCPLTLAFARLHPKIFWVEGRGGGCCSISSFCCPRLNVSRVPPRETSPAAKSEEKGMFPQARGQSVLRPLEHRFDRWSDNKHNE